jgi:hypothetical protein
MTIEIIKVSPDGKSYRGIYIANEQKRAKKIFADNVNGRVLSSLLGVDYAEY